MTISRQTCVIFTAWATKNFPTQPTKWKTANAAELAPLYLCLQLPQEQAPELKLGIDLKLANSSAAVEIPELYLECCATASSLVRSHLVLALQSCLNSLEVTISTTK